MNHCSVRVSSGESTKSFIDKQVKALIKECEIINRLDILSLNDECEAISSQHGKYCEMEYNNLAQLLLEIVKTLTIDNLIIQAEASFQIPEDTLDETDTFSFNTRTFCVTLKLKESSFQSTPGLQKVGEIKRLKETKKGHGSRCFVSYSYSIQVVLSSGSCVPAELTYILNKLFGRCSLRLSIYGDNEQISSLIFNDVKMVRKVLPSEINVQVFRELNYKDRHEMANVHEFLTLLFINNTEVSRPSDDFISTYVNPETKVGSLVQMRRDSVKNINPAALYDISKLSFFALSILTGRSHILVLKGFPENRIISWIST
ncbi:uncharacterized protein PRCAT00003599001 [Priceomyces carsonii]|uniref:uncharacterized protein n=1 Tax=Priceomyces carsonii TaxID=28549 RepID=UPI002ED8F84D|nr:unnamed protein product [Priceomyces carsonii]